MKIAITSTGPNWDSLVDARFGRADYILIVTEGSEELEVIDNRAVRDVAHGAGPQTAQLLHDHAPGALITGNGPGANAADILKRMNVQVYIGAAGMSIRDALKAYQDNKLKKGD
ncbi:MAG: dinitrogenase iron-molybdenum cofactor biosynthesis protein [Candidatus Cloacimonetes bacterium]|nr:dinitrogenase iron-molybdenum cofactor biosynthesis protein [Candidatus Cloacimonadota bacterium]